MSEVATLRAAAAFLAARGIGVPRAALVLGSGLAEVAARIARPIEVRLGDVPGWPEPRVAGHGARLLAGDLDGVAVACLTGRVHLYEGWSPREVVRAVRTLRLLGVRHFLLTNAAGGIRPGLRAGDLAVLSDHINLTGCSPLVGPAEEELGPRFPDQTEVYAPALRAALCRIDAGLVEGVYAGLLGPSYETPAEVRMLAALGADLTGMSTVHEAMALHAMGAEVAAVSLVSNLAAGIAAAPLSHAEVIAAGRAAQERMSTLVSGFCRVVCLQTDAGTGRSGG